MVAYSLFKCEFFMNTKRNIFLISNYDVPAGYEQIIDKCYSWWS